MTIKRIENVLEGSLETAEELYRVCWLGWVEGADGAPAFVSHKSPDAVRLDEAQRRMRWGRRTYPQIIYWAERATATPPPC